MSQINRLRNGLLDRTAPVSFRFDDRTYTGFKGDTLASALLANNVKLVGRSFKYHRPRGILTSGSEEPNALVELREGTRREPNTRATTAELFDGLVAKSQNRWPSLAFDMMGINDLFSNFLTAGFYYKTFMWPKAFWEKIYEPVIRHAAGLGAASGEADPDIYDKGSLHCDILITGAGPAGLAAALTAGRSGARVILADEDFELGGRLNAETYEIEGRPGSEWLQSALDELQSLKNVRLMKRTTVFGAFDHGIHGALERVGDHLADPDAALPRQILWRIYTRQMILCAGATERPIAFENNDRPGIMLAGAVRAYANRWAVAADMQTAIFTNNDDGHRTALDLLARGLDVKAVIDVRPDASKFGDYELLTGAKVIDASGRRALSGVTVRLGDGTTRTLACGALGVSGGWNPAVSLTSHKRGRPVWNPAISAFVPPDSLAAGLQVAGAANGAFTTRDAFREGAEASGNALRSLGMTVAGFDVPACEDSPVSVSPLLARG